MMTANQLTPGELLHGPSLNTYGNDSASFNFKINDGTDDSGEAAITVNINAVNDAQVSVFGSSVTLNVAKNTGAGTPFGNIFAASEADSFEIDSEKDNLEANAA